MKINFPELHPAQREVAESDARFRVCAAGRRFGKSRLGSALCVAEGLQKRRAWWVAPSYPVAMVGWRMIRQLSAKIPGVEIRRGDYQVIYPGGGEVRVRSADNPDSLRGEGLDLVILDECAFMKEETWNEVLRPSLSDRLGKAIFISTPKGRNFFWRLYQQGINNEKGWQSWRLPTSSNPYIPLSEIESAKRDLPEIIYRQEYLAEFIDSSGGVFRRVQEAAVLEPAEPAPNKQYIAGVDVASSIDYTVVSVLDVATKEMVYLDRFNRVDYPVLIDRLAAVYQRWHLDTMVIEANSIGKPVIDHMIERGLAIVPFTTTSATKQTVIQGLQSAFEHGNIKIIDDPVLVGELLSFESKRNASGSFSYSAPDGMHDDCHKQGTLIKTKDGYKRIEDINPGDLVLTHLGNYKPVEKCIKKPFDGVFYRVKPQGRLSLELSYNHPLYAAMRNYEGDISGDYTRRDWVYPGDWLKTYRTVAIKEQIPKQTLFEISDEQYYKNGVLSGNVKLKNIVVDKNFASFLGRFAADGHCKKNSWYSMELAFNDNETEAIKYYSNYLSDLGISTRVERIKQCKHAVKLLFSSKLLYHIMKETYNEYQERVLPSWVWELGELLSDVLNGWMEADGCEIRGKLIGASISKPLALTMRDIAISIGKYATIQELTNRKRYGKPTKDQYWVTVTETRPYTAHQRMASDFEYISSAKVSESHYKGVVYNLQVADDRSFVANGIVVHNCVMSLAIAWDGLTSNSGWAIY